MIQQQHDHQQQQEVDGVDDFNIDDVLENQQHQEVDGVDNFNIDDVLENQQDQEADGVGEFNIDDILENQQQHEAYGIFNNINLNRIECDELNQSAELNDISELYNAYIREDTDLYTGS